MSHYLSTVYPHALLSLFLLIEMEDICMLSITHLLKKLGLVCGSNQSWPHLVCSAPASPAPPTALPDLPLPRCVLCYSAPVPSCFTCCLRELPSAPPWPFHLFYSDATQCQKLPTRLAADECKSTPQAIPRASQTKRPTWLASVVPLFTEAFRCLLLSKSAPVGRRSLSCTHTIYKS